MTRLAVITLLLAALPAQAQQGDCMTASINGDRVVIESVFDSEERARRFAMVLACVEMSDSKLARPTSSFTEAFNTFAEPCAESIDRMMKAAGK